MAKSQASTAQTNTSVDNRRTLAEGSMSFDNIQGDVEVTTVAPEIVEAALDSVNNASADTREVAVAAISANSDIARRGMQFSTDVVNELIREQDNALARAQTLFSAAATGGASQVAEQSGRIAYAAVAGAVLVAAVALYKR
jgi:hypothetical protein